MILLKRKLQVEFKIEQRYNHTLSTEGKLGDGGAARQDGAAGRTAGNYFVFTGPGVQNIGEPSTLIRQLPPFIGPQRLSVTRSV